MANIFISPNEEGLVKVLDTSNNVGISWIQFGNLQVCAQSFKLGTTGYVSEVELYIMDSDDVDSSVYTMTLEIQSDDGGDPDGIALGTATRTVINTGTNLSNKRWVKFKFLPDERPNLTSGTSYWLVLSSPTADVFFWAHDLGGNPYANGQRAKSADSGNTWTQHATHDHVFKIYRLSSFSLTDIGAFLTSLSWSRRTNASASASIELANPFGKFTNENMTNPSGYNLGNYFGISRGMSITIKIPDGNSTTGVFRGIVVADPAQSSTGGNTISIEALGNLELARKRYIAKRYREHDYDILTSIDYTANPDFESRLTYVEDIVDNLIYTQTDLFTNYGIQFYYDRVTNPDVLHLIKKEFVFDYKTVFECLQAVAEATSQEYYINNDGALIFQDIKDPTDAGTSSSYPILSRGDNIIADNIEENYDNLRNQVIVEGKDGRVVIEEDIESIEDYGLIPYFEKNNDIETDEELATYAQLLLKKYTTINRTGSIELKEFTERCASTIPNSFLDILPGDIVEVEDELLGLYNYTDSSSTFYRVESINFAYDGSLRINMNIASIKIVPELVDLEIERDLQKQTSGGEDSIDIVTTRTTVIKIDPDGAYVPAANVDSRIGRYDSGNYDFDVSLHTSHYGA